MFQQGGFQGYCFNYGEAEKPGFVGFWLFSFPLFTFPSSCYFSLMVIEQTVEVPVNHRLIIDVPLEIPAGPVILAFRPTTVQRTNKAKQIHKIPFTDRLEEVRQLIKKEMAQNGTTDMPVASGDGWEAYVWERYAES